MQLDRSTLTPLDHNPDDPDDVSGFTTPNRPSELIDLSDDNMFRLLRKVAFANQWPVNAKVQFEATARLLAAVHEFKASSDRTARVMIGLTAALVVLTIILVALTIAIVGLTMELE